MSDNYDSSVHSFLKSEVIWLFFQLSRKSKSSLLVIENRLKGNLSFIKNIISNNNKNIQNNHLSQWYPYLQQFFTIIAYTRDSLHGLGEHDLTYMLIYSFFDSFPELSKISVELILKPLDNDLNNVNLGCWRDVKYLCKYVFDSTNQYDHPIITNCISLINDQLYQDIQNWKYSNYCYSKYHISNVAKHIPREKSKYGWLFQKLAIHWIQKHKPCILKTPPNLLSYQKAICKSKSIYRKIVSYLNKVLKTPQISFCKNTEINFDYLTINTYIKNTHLLNNHTLYSDKSKKYIQNIKNNEEDQYFYYYGVHYSQIPIEFIIRKSIYLTKNDNYDKAEESFLDNLWKMYFIKKFNTKSCILPLLDVSNCVNSDSFYAALGNALLLSTSSFFEDRILAIDKSPTWIQFQPEHTIVQKINHFMISIYNMSNTESNYKTVFSLLSSTLQSIHTFNVSPHKIKLILLSQFNKNDLEQLYTNFTLAFPKSKFYELPQLFLWNFAYNSIIDVNTFDEYPDITFISGFSSNTLYYLLQDRLNKNHYDYLSHVLSNNRYKLFSDFSYYAEF
tara:strand:+ start:15495 stop:17177 length:1683 start_codon:yes stop_codon:yes gene_type:complete